MNQLSKVLCLTVVVLVTGACADTRTGSLSYRGGFQCDEINADSAILIWDDEEQRGWFGWVPANAAAGSYALREISSLNFELEFENVYGVDTDATASVTVAFNLDFAPDGERVTGEGSVTRADGSEESCTAELMLE